MDVDQSLDALIKAAPKATKKPTKAASKAKKKVTLKKKVQPKKKVSSVKVSVKSGRGTKMIRKNTGGRGKPIGGRAVGMAIDQVVRNTGGARSRINNIVSPNAKTNEAPTKLIVSNLDFNVTEKDIKDLFSTVARLKKSSLNYGPNGKSKGSGEVIFFNRADALAAMREYSGMKLDGRELQLEIIATSNVGLAPLPIQARLSGRGGPKAPQRMPVGRGIGGRVGPPMGNTGGRARSTGGRNAGGGRGGRGTGGRGRGGPQRMDVQQPKKQTAAKKKAKKPRKPKAKAAPKQPLTAEALDAGLDAYKAQAMES